MSTAYPPPSELFDLAGEVAVITGGGRGIGEGIAHTLAAAGAKVVVAARRAEEVERVAAEIRGVGGDAIAVPTDVTDDAAVDLLARTAVERYGRLSIWVNNAGGSPARMPMTELSREQWNDCIALNQTAVWVGIVTAAKHMDTGSIINISSGAGFGPVPGSGHYGAAKAAVNSLTLTAAAELAPRIRVNGVAPGAIPTEIFMKALGIEDDAGLAAAEAAWAIPLGRFGTPLDIGAAVLFLCSPAASWMSGEMLRVNGGCQAALIRPQAGRRSAMCDAGAVTAHRIRFEGPAALAVRVATTLADADGVELISSAPPSVIDVHTVALELSAEGTAASIDIALAAIRDELPAGGASIDLAPG